MGTDGWASPDAASSPPPAEKTFHYNSQKLLRLAAICSLGIVFGAWFAQLPPTRRGSPMFVGLLVVITSVVGLLQFLLRAAQKGPALVIDDNGIRLPAKFSGLLAWADIRRFEVAGAVNETVAACTLELYPDAVQRLRRPLSQALWQFLNQRPDCVTFQGGLFDAPAAEIVAEIERQMRASEVYRTAERNAVAESVARKPTRAFSWPVGTIALSVLLVAVYWLSSADALSAWPEHRSEILRALGGLSAQDLDAGQLWRAASAPLLHANAGHLALNIMALVVIGLILEPLVGFQLFLVIFVAAAMAGALFSGLGNPPHIVSVGASAGVIGLYAAALVLIPKFSGWEMRQRLAVLIPQAVLAALIPAFGANIVSNIDYAGHWGGAIGGALIGLVINLCWPPDTARLRMVESIAAGLAASYLIVGVGFIATRGVELAAVGRAAEKRSNEERTERITLEAARTEQQQKIDEKRARDEELNRKITASLKGGYVKAPQTPNYCWDLHWAAHYFPSDWEKAKRWSFDWSGNYPRDPRWQLALAAFREDLHQYRSAEEILREILRVKTVVYMGLEAHVRLKLADLLQAWGRDDEARQEVAPVCNMTLAEPLSRYRTDLGLCPAQAEQKSPKPRDNATSLTATAPKPAPGASAEPRSRKRSGEKLLALGRAGTYFMQGNEPAGFARDFPFDWRDAAAFAEKNVEAYPKDIRIQFAYAVALADRGETERAEKTLEKLRKGRRELSIEAELFHADLLQASGRVSEAKGAVDQYCSRDPPRSERDRYLAELGLCEACIPWQQPEGPLE